MASIEYYHGHWVQFNGVLDINVDSSIEMNCGIYLRVIPSTAWLGTAIITLSNENIFPVIRPLWGESTGNRWIDVTKASEAGLCFFLWSALEKNGWTKNQDTAGDLKHHRAHYDVTIMAHTRSFSLWVIPSMSCNDDMNYPRHTLEGMICIAEALIPVYCTYMWMIRKPGRDIGKNIF